MKVKFNSFRADKDIEKIPDDAEPSQVIDIVNKAFNWLEFFSKNISIRSNFNGYVAENVKIPALEKVQIQHFLGVIPKWRIILKQSGNGVITDIPDEWTTNVISLKNNGVEDVTISVLIARE